MKRICLLTLMLSCFTLTGQAQRVTDKLDRGLVAVPASSGNLVSWRIFAEEYYGVTYNLYANGSLLKSGLTASDFNHTSGSSTTKYQVAAVVKGVEQEKSAEVTRWNNGYLQFPVAKVQDRNGNDVIPQYIINDISLGEVDGDGVAEFLKSEIRICNKRLEEEPSPYYDGVNVGFTNAQELNINHIRFCKKLLEMMNFEQ